MNFNSHTNLGSTPETSIGAIILGNLIKSDKVGCRVLRNPPNEVTAEGKTIGHPNKTD
jgi:hypothetical protein